MKYFLNNIDKQGDVQQTTRNKDVKSSGAFVRKGPYSNADTAISVESEPELADRQNTIKNKKKPQAAESHAQTTRDYHPEQNNNRENKDDDDVMKTTHANDVNTKHDASRLEHEKDGQPKVKDDNPDVSHLFQIAEINLVECVSNCKFQNAF